MGRCFDLHWRLDWQLNILKNFTISSETGQQSRFLEKVMIYDVFVPLFKGKYAQFDVNISFSFLTDFGPIGQYLFLFKSSSLASLKVFLDFDFDIYFPFKNQEKKQTTDQLRSWIVFVRNASFISSTALASSDPSRRIRMGPQVCQITKTRGFVKDDDLRWFFVCLPQKIEMIFAQTHKILVVLSSGKTWITFENRNVMPRSKRFFKSSCPHPPLRKQQTWISWWHPCMLNQLKTWKKSNSLATLKMDMAFWLLNLSRILCCTSTHQQGLS